MNARAIVATTLCLLLATRSARGSDRWCGDSSPLCPPHSLGWMLFNDSNLGTPDFWFGPGVDVREILVCRHGIQFLFLTNQKGRPHHTALVFPEPSRRMLAARLDPEPGRLDAEYAHYRGRYENLLASLGALSGGTLRPGRRLSFERDKGRPVVVPGRRLLLRWKGQVRELRGYLDVYFAPVADPG